MCSRVVSLVDMDCFYCQVEQRLDPSLKGKPLAVVQYNKWKGGGIIAVNYEARKFGVTRQMRGNEAKAKCPDIALVHVPEKSSKADISKYRDAGREVIDVLCEFSSCVERASIDEAYLDLTEAVEQRLRDFKESPRLTSTFVVGYDAVEDTGDREAGREEGVRSWLQDQQQQGELRLVVAAQLVEEMRAAVLERTGFTCSAGIAHNKTLSKLVCGLNKPNRQTVLPEDQVSHLYATLPVRKVRSLGGKLGETLVQTLGVSVMADLEKFSEPELCQKFEPKIGCWLYNIARGIDNEPVNARLIPKSIGCCKRFPGRTALATQQEVEYWITELAKEISERLNKDYEENKRRARGMIVQWSVEVGGSSCSKTGSLGSYEASHIAAEALQMLNKADTAPLGSAQWKPPLQFLGINVTKFSEEENKNSSIQKFFKPVTKAESPSKKENEVTPCGSKDLKCKSGDLKSFFLNHTKKTEDLVCTADVEKTSDVSMQQPELCEVSSSDEDLESTEVPEVQAGPTGGGGEAPCPQCSRLFTLEEMSEHLDMHVAEELHQQLNGGPSQQLHGGPSHSHPKLGAVAATVHPKKRKYTKAASKTNVKSKRIDSFFTQN